MIWLVMLVPFAVIAILLRKFRPAVVWWELVILAVAPALFVLAAKFTVEHIQVTDTEYWGGLVVRAEYYEDWDERVSCRHSYDCNCTTDKDGRRSCSTCYAHAYDIDYHPAYWQVIDSNGAVFYVGQAHFENKAQMWGSRQFYELNRSYHSNDGDAYVAYWNWSLETSESTTTEHSYENRVAVSDSIFNYPAVLPETKTEFGLFDYPAVQGYWQPSIIGVSDSDAEKKFQYLNGSLGRAKQVKVFVAVYTDQPIQASFEQEAFWKNGNKNELIICIGVDTSGAVQWARCFSWTEVESLKTDIASFVMGQQQLNLSALADWLYLKVEADWSRKQFADFSYLSVRPPLWASILVWILTVALTGGLSVWIVKNEFGGRDEERHFNRGWLGGSSRNARSDWRTHLRKL